MKAKQFLGEAIKHYRKSNKMTQSDLAIKMHMVRTTIIAIEQNKRGLQEHEISEFESVLGLTSGALLKSIGTTKLAGVHINFGYRTGAREKGEKCWYCGSKPNQFFYTYFGVPLCAQCWDTEWRLTEDGETDPPSSEITNRSSGVWL